MPKSAANLARDMASPFLHPIDTVVNVGKLLGGTAAKAIPGRQAWEAYPEAVGRYFADRYSGVGNIKKRAAVREHRKRPRGHCRGIVRRRGTCRRWCQARRAGSRSHRKRRGQGGGPPPPRLRKALLSATRHLPASRTPESAAGVVPLLKRVVALPGDTSRDRSGEHPSERAADRDARAGRDAEGDRDVGRRGMGSHQGQSVPLSYLSASNPEESPIVSLPED